MYAFSQDDGRRTHQVWALQRVGDRSGAGW